MEMDTHWERMGLLVKVWFQIDILSLLCTFANVVHIYMFSYQYGTCEHVKTCRAM